MYSTTPRHRPRLGAARVALLLLHALGVLAQGAVAQDTAPPAAPVTTALRNAGLPGAGVSVFVQAVDEAQPRLQWNADVARNPASVAKLITTWGALSLLGPTHTWTTEIHALGPIQDGVLEGDLLIRGGGDPLLVAEELWKLTGELRGLGLREVRGDLLLDDSLYAADAGDPGDFDNQPFRLYNVLPSATLVNFNAMRFHFEPRAQQGTVLVRADPALPNLRISSEMTLTAGACHAGGGPRIQMLWAEPGRRDHLLFRGTMPAGCRGYNLSRAALDSQAYAFGMFHKLWGQWGGTITGTQRPGVAPAGAEALLLWHSRPLAEIIRPLNKWSNNVMTRLLLLAVGAARLPPPVSREGSAAVLLEHLASEGLDVRGVVLDNGSGLSRETRASARFLTDLLRLAWRQPTMPEYVSSLSIVGMDGTTRSRFRGRAEGGRMHLKTGRLNDVTAVAGYVHAASGKTFAVAILVNHANAQRGAGQRLQDELLAWVFAQ